MRALLVVVKKEMIIADKGVSDTDDGTNSTMIPNRLHNLKVRLQLFFGAITVLIDDVAFPGKVTTNMSNRSNSK